MAAGAPAPRWALPFAWGGALVFVLSLSWFLYSFLVRFSRTPEETPAWRPILIDVALFTVFSLHHSVFARPAAKEWLRHAIHPAVHRSLFTWIASLLFIGVCWWWQFVPGVAYRIPPPWSWVGYGAQIAGLLLTFQGSRRLDVLNLGGVRPILNVVHVAAPHHVPLLTDGVFRVVRHPLYLGWALFVFGAPDMTMTRFVFAVVSTAYIALAIPLEERGLVREFGEQYEQYRQQVRWRMIPGVY